jgi:hypothetical protein
VRGTGKAALPAVMIMMVFAGGCLNGPDPWSPKTYPLELRQFKRDTGSLPGEWKEYRIKGQEDNSFFFAREGTDEIISVYYTCGKYQDISLDLLAEHLIIPMGRRPEVLTSRYVAGTDGKVYHLVAKGRYQYHKKTKYKKLGVVPDLFAEEVMDAYVVKKRHCVVDVVYVAPPDEYAAGLDDFHAYLASVKVAVDEEK